MTDLFGANDGPQTLETNLDPEQRQAEIRRLAHLLNTLSDERTSAQALLEVGLEVRQQALLSWLLETHALEQRTHQAIQVLIALSGHETRVTNDLVSQVTGYRQALGLPAGDQNAVGSASWARSRRSLTSGTIQQRVKRELAALRAREVAHRARQPTGEGTARPHRRPSRSALLEHFSRRLRERYGLSLSRQALEMLDERARALPAMEVATNGEKIKLVEIEGRPVWVVTTRSQEGPAVLTTALTFEMVREGAYRRGDAVPDAPMNSHQG